MYEGEEEDKVTFIIPVFNLFKNDETAKRAIRGLYNYKQLRDCDIIVSDYGSTDRTRELIESFELKYIYTEPNEGEEFNYCKCGNHGISVAKTKYICVLGVDWIIDPRVPGMIVEGFKKFKNHILQIQSNELKDSDKRIIFNQVFYERCHLILCKGYDERFNRWGNEDNDLLKRCCKTNHLHKKKISNKTLARHITHPYVWRKKKYESSNIYHMKDNDKNGNKNVKNSYWNLKGAYIRKIKANYIERFAIPINKPKKVYRCG